MQHVVMATRVVPVLPQPSLDLPRKPDRRRPELNMSIEDSQKRFVSECRCVCVGVCVSDCALCELEL